MTQTLLRALLASMLIFLISAPAAAFAAYNQSCAIISWNPNYPAQVNPGQTFDITSTIDINCAQWRTFYSARVDLIDRSSGQLFSTSTFQIGWQPNVTSTISNAGIAPQSSGQWKLQLNLYIFEEGSLVTSFTNPFNIDVVAPNAPAPQQNETTTSTSQSQNISALATLQPQASANPNTASSQSFPTLFLAAILVAIALVGAGLLVEGRSRRTSSKPQSASPAAT